MPTALVRNGRVVTASESYEADLYVDGGKIALVGQGLSLPADTVIDASGCPRPAGRDRRPHAPRHAGRGAHLGRRLRDRHPGRRLRRHDDRRRLRDAGARPVSPRRPRHVEAQGRGQGGRGLRLPHGPARGGGDDARRDGPPDPRRGCHLLQAVPGLSRGPAGGRRGVLPGAARRARVRGAPPRPRRERRGHRRPGEAGPGARRDGAAAPRPHAPAGDGGGGHRPGDRDGRDGRRAALRRPPHLRGGARPRDGGPRPRAPGPRRDLPAVPLPVDRRLRPARASTGRGT